MSDQQDYDPSRVMLNGAAIGLVTALTGAMEKRLIAEIKAAEERQNSKLESAIRAITGDVDALQDWREDMDDARLIRQGQLSVLSGIARFADRYGKVILSVALVLAPILAALAGGVQVSLGG